MQRRSLLAAAGTAVGAGVAGCLDALGGPADGDDSAEGPRDLGEAAAVDDAQVAVESATVQRSLIQHHLWRDLYEPADGQLLVVEASIDGEIEGVGDARGGDEPLFSARLDGERVDSAMRVPRYGNAEWAALSVPVRSVEAAAVVLEAGDGPAWRLPAAARERLAAAPEYHVHDAALREAGDGTVLDLVVENRGDRDGTFRAVVASASGGDMDAPVRLPVAAGETLEETVRHSLVDRGSAERGFTHEVDPGTRRFVLDD